MWQLFVSNNFFLKKIFEGHFLLLATYHLLGNKFLISSPLYSHHYRHPPWEETKWKMYLNYNDCIIIVVVNYSCYALDICWNSIKKLSYWAELWEAHSCNKDKMSRCECYSWPATTPITSRTTSHFIDQPSPSHPANQLSIQYI